MGKARIRLLRALVRQSLYVVEERTVAEAIIARVAARRAIVEQSLRSDGQEPLLRSLRCDPQAHSSRLTSSIRRRSEQH